MFQEVSQEIQVIKQFQVFVILIILHQLLNDLHEIYQKGKLCYHLKQKVRFIITNYI